MKPSRDEIIESICLDIMMNNLRNIETSLKTMKLVDKIRSKHILELVDKVEADILEIYFNLEEKK